MLVGIVARLVLMKFIILSCFLKYAQMFGLNALVVSWSNKNFIRLLPHSLFLIFIYNNIKVLTSNLIGDAMKF